MDMNTIIHQFVQNCRDKEKTVDENFDEMCIILRKRFDEFSQNFSIEMKKALIENGPVFGEENLHSAEYIRKIRK